MPSLSEVMFSEENRAVTNKLINYSIAMVVAPIATFYFLYVVVFESNVLMLEWSGLGAVIMANVVIFAYVKMAWEEDRGEVKDKKDKGGKGAIGKMN